MTVDGAVTDMCLFCSPQAHKATISNQAALDKFQKLPQLGKVIAEYVWIDSSSGVRSKCRVSLSDIWIKKIAQI